MESKNTSENMEYLLNRSFLDLDFEDPKNQKVMEAVANHYFTPRPTFWRFKNRINQILLITISLAAIVIIYINDFETSTLFQPIQSAFISVADTIKDDNIENEMIDENHYFKVNQIDIKSIEQIPISKSESLILTQIPLHDIERFSNTTVSAKKDSIKPYVFPKLNEEDKEKTKVQKEKILKRLNKVDKEFYQFVTIGEFKPKKGEEIKIKDFYMSVGEVTNLEYRTYLFDLLMQGRKDEFLISKPTQENWSQNLGEQMSPYEKLYFSHPAYNNYPVVNVTPKGAENFCKWLLEEFEKYNKKKKIRVFEIGIPIKYEWIHAAKGGHEKSPYPWGGPYTRNSKGCFLANFDYKSVDKKCEGYDSSRLRELSVSIDEQSLFAGTAPVYSYIPNDFGLYCMSGNVAEIVSYPDRTYGTKGGSWRSPSYEIQIDGPDRFKGQLGSSVEVGFRPLIRFVKL